MNTIKALVYGVSYVNVEGKEYCSVYVGQPSTDTKKYKGIEIMKMDAEPEVFHTVDIQQFPAVAELTISIKRVSGGKMGQVCSAITPVKQVPTNKPSAAA